MERELEPWSPGAHVQRLVDSVHAFPTIGNMAIDKFRGPVLLVRANMVFVGIRYDHLEYKTSKASHLYTIVLTVSGLCIYSDSRH